MLQRLPNQLDIVLRNLRGDQALLARVAAENIGKTSRNNDLETVVAQRPHGVLTGRTGTEVRARHQHATVLVGLLVQDELGVLTPVSEEGVVEAGLGHSLEVDGGNNLVGVNIRRTQRHANAGVLNNGFHNGSLAIAAC